MSFSFVYQFIRDVNGSSFQPNMHRWNINFKLWVVLNLSIYEGLYLFELVRVRF